MIKTFLINFMFIIYFIINLITMVMLVINIVNNNLNIKSFFKDIAIIELIFYILSPFGFVIAFTSSLICKFINYILYKISNSEIFNYKPFKK